MEGKENELFAENKVDNTDVAAYIKYISEKILNYEWDIRDDHKNNESNISYNL